MTISALPIRLVIWRHEPRSGTADRLDSARVPRLMGVVENRVITKIMSRLQSILKPTLALAAAFFMAACVAETGPNLAAPDAFSKARSGEMTLIDIRTPQEWRQTGVAEGALTIDMTRKTFVEELLRAVDGDKDAPIAIICRTGNRTT